MITVGELHQENPKLVEKFVRKLFAKEIKKAGKDIIFEADDECYLECDLAEKHIVIDIDSVRFGGEFDENKAREVMRFMTKVYGQDFIDEIVESKKAVLDDMILDLAKYNEYMNEDFSDLSKIVDNNRKNEIIQNRYETFNMRLSSIIDYNNESKDVLVDLYKILESTAKKETELKI